jgi:hypothetical protein
MPMGTGCNWKQEHTWCWYYTQLVREAKIPTVEKWLSENPPPADWLGCKWAWAFTEMAILRPLVL